MSAIGCKGHVKILTDGTLVEYCLEHSHDPPNTGECNVGLKYDFIPTNKGKHLILLDGYTFSQKGCPSRFSCSKRLAGCKASVKINRSDGSLYDYHSEHNHERPKYVKTVTGQYLRVR